MVKPFSDSSYSHANEDSDLKSVDNPNYIEIPREALEGSAVHIYESADPVHQVQAKRVPGTRGAHPSNFGYSEPIDSIACGTKAHFYSEPLHTTPHGLLDTRHDGDWKTSHFGSRQPNSCPYYETPVDGKTDSNQYCIPVDCCESVIIKGRTYAVLTKSPPQQANIYQPSFNESGVNLVSYDRLEHR